MFILDPLLTPLNARGPLGSGLCAVLVAPLALVLGIDVGAGVAEVGVLPPVGILAGNRKVGGGLRLPTILAAIGGATIFEGDGEGLKDLG